jgi:hypothetical protein
VKQFVAFCAAGMVAGGVFVSGQISQIPEPRRGFGASVTPAYEGWFYNPDGSRSFRRYHNETAGITRHSDRPEQSNWPGGPDGASQPISARPSVGHLRHTIAPKDFADRQL